MALTYPWFLLGLLVIAIPIAIHLFELRRPQRLLFTNVGFIREIKLITARQRQVKHLLVLLARICFLGFLTLLFCQPFVPAKKATEAVGEVAAVVDASPSMQVLGATDQPLFERAISEAHDLPAAYSGNTRFRLPEYPSLLSSTAFQAAVEQLTITGAAGSVPASLKRISYLPKPAQHVFIFSDFQKNAATLQQLRAESDQQIFLVPLGGRPTANVFVDSVLLDDAFVRIGTDILLRIRLRNGGSVAAPDCQVKVFVGEQQVAAYRTAVSAHGSAIGRVRVRLGQAQLQQCRVELEDFPVTFDNTYYFTLQPSPKIRVLDIAASEQAPTRRLYGNEPLFEYTAGRPQSVDYRSLAAANLTLLQEVPTLDAGLREALHQTVQKGGTLVIVPPAGTAARASYTELFRALGIGAVQWEATPAGAPVLQEVAEPSLQNPFFRDVFSGRSRQVVMPKAAPVLHWSRSGTDVLRMRTGEGYLAGFASGRGMVYLFAAPFREGYSDFPAHALFVPVMYRLAMQSYQTEQHLAYRLNQGTVALEIKADAGNKQEEAVAKLIKDSLTFIPSQRQQADGLRFEVPTGMREPGFYTVTRNGKPLTTLAFNIDKRESDLACYSAAELRQQIGAGQPRVQVYEAGAGQSVAAQYKAERVGTPLWRYCLWLALASLLAEVLLLRFMGRPHKPVPVAVAA